MKRLLILVVFLVVPISAKGAGPFQLNAGMKVPVGITLFFPSLSGMDSVKSGEAGFGGYVEFIILKILGFEFDFIYEQHGIWGTDGVGLPNILRFPFLLKLKIGGTYLSFGPHFILDGGKRVDIGGAIGYEVSIPRMKVNVELPVVMFNTWEEEGTYVDFQVRFGLGVGIF